MYKFHIFLEDLYEGFYWADSAYEAKEKYRADTGYEGSARLIARLG